ncbi:galactokinase [Aestuariimicrobium sp. T2.26MG-19.2B]|uniref:galactokinase n=1 Tax=Aestuariimicrobium sp. T2.26MG-19.2B TaxID=3040679 RepID=UPI002477A2F2|nr:galactokinase [Aestuariimicrobium sp. T2.26MG-19.2B]CAI9410504.1 Galactokinase [Aestuariimicrobium sp. T2.26MG-19.2B]
MKDIQVLLAAHRELAGVEPELVWAGPGRVNLIGEHTDYNDGFVMPFALEQCALVSLSKRDDDRVLVQALDLDQRHEVGLDELRPFDHPEAGERGWWDYLTGCIWAIGGIPTGVTVVLSSDVPFGAGLSSSAAIECAMIGGLCDLFGLDIAPLERATLARKAENAYVGAPTGLLDQAASTLCTEGNTLVLDCRTHDTEQVPMDLGAAGLEILVFDTKTPHSHVDGEYVERRASCERAALLLGVPALRDVTDLDEALAKLATADDAELLTKRVRHVVTEDERVLRAAELAQAGEFEALAPLLDASHASMRDDFEITVPTVDLAVERARAAGALGARMTGGGFGGCIIALCRAGEGDTIGQTIAGAFADAGYGAPAWFTATPAAGARRIL